jgi:DNA-binding winged helix-turn-helix (wHTH) protein
MNGMLEQDRYAPTYCATEAQQVMGWLKAGQSGCLVGLRGTGKSNFLRFLLRQGVQQYYLGHDHTDFIFTLINLLALGECTEWAVYELMLDRLLGRVRSLGTEEIIEEVASLHREVRRSRDALVARRAVERCVGLVCQRLSRRLVLLFDEFGDVFKALDPSLFRCLRAIRDAHKGRVSYIVVVANSLTYLRDDVAQVEHFYRLVSRNVCHLGPYNEADARQMAHHLASQRPIELSEKDVTRLLELSGGHAGLLKALLSLLWDIHYEGSLTEWVSTFNTEPVIRDECRKIWGNLSTSEQVALYAVVSGAPVDPQILWHLRSRGLLREDLSEPSLFSPLFAAFVHQQVPPSMKDTVVSRLPPIVRVDGRRVEGLTELEFEILCYLYEHRGRVCTKDELIENVYRQRYDRLAGGVTDDALQALISRLRAKIEPDRARPRYVVTVRGEGYKFVGPDKPQARV